MTTPTGATATWHDLIDELFDAEMREAWGWKAPRSLEGVAVPAPTARVRIDAQGLSVPYFCGWIHVDFGRRTVTCLGVDQKTPADERWDLTPSEQWWERAAALPWPDP